MLSGVAIRKPGGGRKRTMEQDETLVRDLERLIEPLSRGDPDDPLIRHSEEQGALQRLFFFEITGNRCPKIRFFGFAYFSFQITLGLRSETPG
jgi:hypothetical protein